MLQPLTTTAKPLHRMTYPEYLRLEATSTEKHEFIAGDVYAMAGGTIEHGAIATAFARDLANALEGKPCRVYNSDVRVRVQDSKFSSYPDVSVVCDQVKTDADDEHGLLNPVVLGEVLSEGTEGYDRGAKAMHYRRISSLREYVLVSVVERLIEVQRLNPQGIWEIHVYGMGQQLQLASLGISIPVDRIYANPLSAG